MHAVDFLQDLAVVMIVAAVVTVLFRVLKQPVILGYIIAGLIIGPHTPPYAFIHDEATIGTLSELGVILLMFSLGLEFSISKLKSVGTSALIAAVTENLLLFWLGYEIGHFFGWSVMDRVFMGAMLSMSSTTVIIKVLADLGMMKERFAQICFGILILEDIFGIAMIVLLSGIAMTGTFTFVEVGVTLGKLGLFIVTALVAGLLLVPRLISGVSKFRSNEMLGITVLGLCFGVSLLALKLGYSVALGAFVIGAVIAETREIHRIEKLVEPVRDMFSAIFFVSIGLLIDPMMLVEYWKPIAVITTAVVVGKILTGFFGTFAGGNDGRTSLKVGMSLAQIGEFSFIIASLGLSLKVTSDFLYPVAVAVSAITTFFTPYFIKGSDRATDFFRGKAPQSLARILGLYTAWAGRLGAENPGSRYRRLMWRFRWQIVLDAALIAVVFLFAAYIGANPPGWLASSGIDEVWLNAALWLTAAIVSLPMFIASARNLHAAGLLFADHRVSERDAGAATQAIRTVVAAAVPAAGSVTLGVFVLLLSSTILPPLNVMLVLVAVIVFLAWRMWKTFVRVYASAQIAIADTLAAQPESETEEAGPSRHGMLEESNVETVEVGSGCIAAGKLIRELELRARTGASIVCIERSGSRTINPGPDEEIQEGDKLLLLGAGEQLHSAREYLSSATASQE
jgi:CPA2 family monovalent cation:H+ antiporter-2